jgi:hypothetical protein
MNRPKNVVRTAALGLAFAATAALASVTFYPATGTGFVGKGDVQSAFGWNNAALQANVSGISFTYESDVTWHASCYFVTGEGTRGEKEHFVPHHKSTSVAGTVQWSARVHHQVDGINLTGFTGDTVESGGEVPVAGAPCPGNPGHDGVWVNVYVEPGSSTGGLYVWYNGVKKLLGNF